MKEKAQVLIIFLWILAALAVITLGLSSRIFTVLKFTGNRKNLLKAEYLAYAGVNLAISELRKDDPAFDGLTDTWADNKTVFEKIRLSDNPVEYASVIGTEKFGVIDEERKININKASKEQILALLEYYEIPSAQHILDNLLIYRGDNPDNEKIYEDMGYPVKARIFSNLSELMLIKGMSPEDLQKISGVITVHGEGGLNANTASAEVIKIFCRAIAKQNNVNESFADTVADQFISLRDTQLVFKDAAEIKLEFTTSEELNIFNALLEDLRTKSNNFLIEVKGNAGKIKAMLKIVYNRQENKIESYYER